MILIKTFLLLLPALLPSWRFFDWIAPSPRIDYRCKGQDVWHAYDPPHQDIAPHVLKRLFWNAQWNDYLFMMSCAERLMQTPTEDSKNQIIQRLKTIAPTITQFRLIFVTRNNRQIAYISDEIS